MYIHTECTTLFSQTPCRRARKTQRCCRLCVREWKTMHRWPRRRVRRHTHTMAAAESFGPDLEEPKKLCFFYSRLQHRTTKAGASNSGTPPPSPSPACQRIATTAWRRRRRPRELKLRNCAVLRRRVRRGASIGHHISLSI